MKKALIIALLVVIAAVAVVFQRSAQRSREEARTAALVKLDQFQHELVELENRLNEIPLKAQELKQILDDFTDVAVSELASRDRLVLVSAFYSRLIDSIEIPDPAVTDAAAVARAQAERSRLAREMGEVMEAIRSASAQRLEETEAERDQLAAERLAVLEQMREVAVAIRERREALQQREPAEAREALAAVLSAIEDEDKPVLIENREEIAALINEIETLRSEDEQLQTLQAGLVQLHQQLMALNQKSSEAGVYYGVTGELSLPAFEWVHRQLEALENERRATESAVHELTEKTEILREQI